MPKVRGLLARKTMTVRINVGDEDKLTEMIYHHGKNQSELVRQWIKENYQKMLKEKAMEASKDA